MFVCLVRFLEDPFVLWPAYSWPVGDYEVLNHRLFLF